MDVDLYFLGALGQAIDDLREAADTDIGDFFSFDVSPGAALSGGTTGWVLRLTAYLGDKVFETFPVDVVVAHTMTAEPDVTPPIEFVRHLVDPVLDGQTTGQWNPDTLGWDE
jgi:hypothetical protein